MPKKNNYSPDELLEISRILTSYIRAEEKIKKSIQEGAEYTIYSSHLQGVRESRQNMTTFLFQNLEGTAIWCAFKEMLKTNAAYKSLCELIIFNNKKKTPQLEELMTLAEIHEENLVDLIGSIIEGTVDQVEESE